MTLFDSTSEEPRHKMRRYAISIVAVVALLGYFVWHELRFEAEKHTAERFLNAVISSQLQQAFRIWKPNPSYAYQDFLDDWGPDGYYGPVRSYHLESVQLLKSGASGVVVTVDVSPDSTFPDVKNAPAMNRVKLVRLWIERKDQSISFAP